MEHVFGRYVECPYNVKILFYNRQIECPSNIMRIIGGEAFDIWIKSPQNMENTLYYDPTLGRDKVITLGDSFPNGSAIKDSSYIPCQELMYYAKDMYENGFRELDFYKIGALRLFMESSEYIRDHGMSTRNIHGFCPDKFAARFLNFPGRGFLSSVLKDPGLIYKGKEVQVVFRETIYEVYDKEDINQTSGIWRGYP